MNISKEKLNKNNVFIILLKRKSHFKVNNKNIKI
jgi:hypothetical protein